MKKFTAILLVLAIVLCVFVGCSKKTTTTTTTTTATSTAASAETKKPAETKKDYSGYTVRIYSNSNSTERVTWLKAEAEKAGFKISWDDSTVYTGDAQAVQAANEKKDGDILFGLNETRWSELINGDYAGVKIMDWTPSWDAEVDDKYAGKAYGLVKQGALMLYRTDEFGTNGKRLSFKHWDEMLDAGYTWYRQNKISGSTNTGLNKSILFPYVDPSSPAGGISIEGWKRLWKYCAEGISSADSSYKYGFDPLNKAEVAISSYFTSSLFGNIDNAAETSAHPLKGTMVPENWDYVDVEDGVNYICEYLGIIDKAGRTAEQTEAVKAFAEWFGSAEVQAAWGEEFDSFPCNKKAAAINYPEGAPKMYTMNNMSLRMVPGTNMTFSDYATLHDAEWTNILTNLGFYWTDMTVAHPEPDWNNLNWAVLTQK